MSNYVLAFFNFFIIPLISLKIFYKRNLGNGKFPTRLQLLLDYGTFASLDLVFEKLIVALLRKFFPLLQIDDGSGRYTLVGVVAAFLLPYGIEICKKLFSVKCRIGGEKGNEKN